jgi:hypothetical protein
MEPTSISKKTQRVQQPVAEVEGFPDPAQSFPTKFTLQIKGFIFPRSAAQALDEITKNPDTEAIAISLPEEQEQSLDQTWISGLYTVAQSNVQRKKPIYTQHNGIAVEVYDYTITFLAFADTGADQTADEAGAEEDEPGTGFLDMDADDDGKIDLEGIFEFLTSIFTWGASDPV